MAFAKRPAEELYDLQSDPDQLNNVAGTAEYEETLATLLEQLTDQLVATEDPREIGGWEFFEEQPYLGGGGGKHPDYLKK